MERKMRTLKISLPVFILTITISAQWYQQNSGTSNNLYSVSFFNESIGYTVGMLGQILKTTDGGDSWQSQTSGTTSSLFGVDFYDSNLGYACGDDGVLLKTTNGGDTWYALQVGTIYDINAVSFPEANIGYIIYSNFIAKTTNGGEYWSVLDTFLLDGLYAMDFSDSLHGTIVTIYQYGQTSKILRTNDGGSTWVEQNSGVYAYLFGVDFVDAFNGMIIGMNGIIIRTTDGGNTWINSISGTTHNLSDIFYTDINNATAVGYNGTILRTTNSGFNWSIQESNTNQELYAVVFTDPNNGTAVGKFGTILHTINGGIPVELISFTADALERKVELTWSTATETNNSGFEILRSTKENDWNKIGFVPGHGTTTETQHYSFTDNDVKSGKYRYKLKQIDYSGEFEYSQIVEVEIPFVNEFSLSQNYPNPFNPSTTLQYAIGSRQFVTLKVYDLLGREVATLVNEEKPDGEYEVEFNAANLPSGIYFYQLKAGSFVEVRKMILLK
jgi:photosystem II stability/assembly factor-like uncharacterized protein